LPAPLHSLSPACAPKLQRRWVLDASSDSFTVSPRPRFSVSFTMKWYCLRTQQKREHIAAAHVRIIEGVDVYCPRLRYEKMTRRGKVWFREALFPGYFFARMHLPDHQKLVTYAPGITGIIRFGLWPTVVPDSAIDDLRAYACGGEHEIIAGPIAVGDQVTVTTGAFRGLSTFVTQVLPAAQRVKILLEFLDDCRQVEIPASDLLVETHHILAA
jgi:transcriptional antiterminator RfaH